MFIGSIEDLSRANVADYERRVSRLLLEREARAAVKDGLARAPLTNHPRLPWNQTWRPWRTAT